MIPAAGSRAICHGYPENCSENSNQPRVEVHVALLPVSSFHENTNIFIGGRAIRYRDLENCPETSKRIRMEIHVALLPVPVP